MSDKDNADQNDEPELVVDTDWKEQVAREKEAIQEANSDDDSAAAESPDDEAVQATASAEEGGAPPPPPATFEVLISMMFTQAMAMLGQMPDPVTGGTKVNKPYAKHYIDTLEMLGEKTKGNLSSEEEKMLSEALHALRMMYVNAKADS